MALLFPFFVRWGGGGGGGRGWQGLAWQEEVLTMEWEQLFSYVTHCINLIPIALRFYEDMP